jgi:hypothetical protein
VIRNVVIHLINEQPLLADVEALPAPTDIALVCTNVRTMNGTRPVFVDHSESTFVFPYAQIRFVEMPDAARAGKDAGGPGDRSSGRGADRDSRSAQAPAAPEPELEIDEDFLRRVREI